MTSFLFEGGIVFMSILTLLFLAILSLAVIAGISAFRSDEKSIVKAKTILGHLKSLALFALVFAVFSQILGLVDIFGYLADEDANTASSVLAKGIKLTFHPTLYGLIIYLSSILIVLGLKFRLNMPIR